MHGSWELGGPYNGRYGKRFLLWLFIGLLSSVPPREVLYAVSEKGAKECVCRYGFADVAQKILPAVVDISGTSAPSPVDRTDPNIGLTPDKVPLLQGGHRRSLGAGFVVDPSGYILTNGHVIHEIDSVTVSLSDGSVYPAQVIGKDERTDLALLKIVPPVPLPFLAWGDSHQARVGDWVLVAGSPFGFGRSISAGIISARARDISQMSGEGGPEGLFMGYVDDLIQTDAAINLGNSGGPMVDVQGNVIGVNVAIYSPSGGSVGIGFAVPSGVAQRVYKALRATGHVSYGWIGVRVQEVDNFIATSLKSHSFYKKGIKGALVSGLDPEGSAAKAGLEPSDIILSVGGQNIESYDRLTRIVGETSPGTVIPIRLWRSGKVLEKNVHVEAWSLEKGAQKKENSFVEPSTLPYSATTPGLFKERILGLSLLPLTPSMATALGLPEGAKGLYVVQSNVLGGEVSMTMGGIREADVIVEVNNMTVGTPQNLEDLLSSWVKENKRALLFKIWRQGQAHYIGVSLPSSGRDRVGVSSPS